MFAESSPGIEFLSSDMLVIRPDDDDPQNPFENLFDSDWRTFWRTNTESTAQSYELVFNLLEQKTVYGLYYQPPPYNAEGRIVDWEIFTSYSSDYFESINSGSFERTFNDSWPDKEELFRPILFGTPVKCQYLKLIAKTTQGNCFSTARFAIITEQCDHLLEQMTLEYLKGLKMAPSVHLTYELPACSLVYGEMTVRKSSPGSFFMAVGFRGGYFGLQELVEPGEKTIIFSVWDSSNTDDPNSVAPELQVHLEHKHQSVRVGQFGGEGTGGQSFLDFDWQIDVPYRFIVKYSCHLPERVSFSGYFFDPYEKQWLHLVKFSTPIKVAALEDVGSFVEDFRRDFDSFHDNRHADFKNYWAYLGKGKWKACQVAKFSCDSNPHRNVNAGVINDEWFLATGGKTVNCSVLLGETATLSQFPYDHPNDIPEGLLQ